MPIIGALARSHRIRPCWCRSNIAIITANVTDMRMITVYGISVVAGSWVPRAADDDDHARQGGAIAEGMSAATANAT
jgi:hypothetical protein